MSKMSMTVNWLYNVTNNKVANKKDTNIDVFHAPTHLNISTGRNTTQIVFIDNSWILLNCSKFKEQSSKVNCMLTCTRQSNKFSFCRRKCNYILTLRLPGYSSTIQQKKIARGTTVCFRVSCIVTVRKTVQNIGILRKWSMLWISAIYWTKVFGAFEITKKMLGCLEMNFGWIYQPTAKIVYSKRYLNTSPYCLPISSTDYCSV